MFRAMSKAMTQHVSEPDAKPVDHAADAIRFMAIKAGIFILIPVLASLIAVWWVLG